MQNITGQDSNKINYRFHMSFDVSFVEVEVGNNVRKFSVIKKKTRMLLKIEINYLTALRAQM